MFKLHASKEFESLVVPFPRKFESLECKAIPSHSQISSSLSFFQPVFHSNNRLYKVAYTGIERVDVRSPAHSTQNMLGYTRISFGKGKRVTAFPGELESKS